MMNPRIQLDVTRTATLLALSILLPATALAQNINNGPIDLDSRTVFPYGNMTAHDMAFDRDRNLLFVGHGASVSILDLDTLSNMEGDQIELHDAATANKLAANNIVLDAPVFGMEVWDPPNGETNINDQILLVAGGTSGLLVVDVGNGEGFSTDCDCSDLGFEAGCYQARVIDDREDPCAAQGALGNNGLRWCTDVAVYTVLCGVAPNEMRESFALATFSSAGEDSDTPDSQLRCYDLPDGRLRWAIDLTPPSMTHMPDQIADYPVAYELSVDEDERAAYIAMGTAGIARVDLTNICDCVPAEGNCGEPGAACEPPTTADPNWWHPETAGLAPEHTDLPGLSRACGTEAPCASADMCAECYANVSAGFGFNPDSEQFERARIASLSLIKADGILYAAADTLGVFQIDVRTWTNSTPPTVRDSYLLGEATADVPNCQEDGGVCRPPDRYNYAYEIQAVRRQAMNGTECVPFHHVFVAETVEPRKLEDRAAPWTSNGVWGYNVSVATGTFAQLACPQATPAVAGSRGGIQLLRAVADSGSAVGNLEFHRYFEDISNSEGATQDFWFRDRTFLVAPVYPMGAGESACGSTCGAMMTLFNQVAKHGVFSFSFDSCDVCCQMTQGAEYRPTWGSFTFTPSTPMAQGDPIAGASIFSANPSILNPELLYLTYEGPRPGILDLAANPTDCLLPIDDSQRAHQFGLLPIEAQWPEVPLPATTTFEHLIRSQSFGNIPTQGWVLTVINTAALTSLSKFWLIDSVRVRDDVNIEGLAAGTNAATHEPLEGRVYFSSIKPREDDSTVILTRQGTRYGALVTTTDALDDRAANSECACSDSTANDEFFCDDPATSNCILDVCMRPVDTHPEMGDWRWEDPTATPPLDGFVPDQRRILWHRTSPAGRTSAAEGKDAYYSGNLFAWSGDTFDAELVSGLQTRETLILPAGFNADDRVTCSGGAMCRQDRCVKLVEPGTTMTGGFTFEDADDCNFSKAKIVIADLDYWLAETVTPPDADDPDQEAAAISFAASETMLPEIDAHCSQDERDYGSPERPYGESEMIRPFAVGYGESLAGHAVALDTAEICNRRYAFVADWAGRILLFDISDEILERAKSEFVSRTRAQVRTAHSESVVSQPVQIPLLQELELDPNYWDGVRDNVTDILYSSEMVTVQAGMPPEEWHFLYVTAGRSGLIRIRLQVGCSATSDWSGLQSCDPAIDYDVLYNFDTEVGPDLPQLVRFPLLGSQAIQFHDTPGLAQNVRLLYQNGTEEQAALLVGDQMTGMVIFGDF